MIVRPLAGFVLALASIAASAQVPVATAPSSYIQPALEELRQAVQAVQPGKWKGANAGKDEVDANLTSIRRDLDNTLPGLLTAADAAPASVAAALPVTRNVGALYDVLLRVVERAKISAPADQLAALDHARIDLDAARRALDDRLQIMATSLESRVTSLQKDLAAKPVAAPTPAPAPPVKKKKSKAKPAPSTS